MLRVTCLGGTGGVTGSNYLIESPGGKKILVDCGLFQGGRDIEERNWLPWPFNPGNIDTLFLTHAHIDHSGRIPKLVKEGFQGQIIASPPHRGTMRDHAPGRGPHPGDGRRVANAKK